MTRARPSGGIEFPVKTTGATKAQSQVGNLAKQFVGLQVVVTGAIGAFKMVTKWVGKSINQFREFEKRMAEVGTILTGLDQKHLPKLTSSIERMSVEFGKSATDMAEGMYDILSAAFEADEGLQLLRTSTKAAVAGLTSVATSVDVFTSILNAWGLEVSQANKISDQLFQTVIRGKLRFEDLASAMGYIAPIAANLGVEFKEVAAALSTVTRQGQHVDMATRGLALGLQNIADITPKAAEAARKYDVDLSAVALQVGGLESVIKDLNRATQEYGMKVLPEMISNMRSLRVFMALTGKEGLQGYAEDMGYLQNATGKTEEAMNEMMQTQQKQAEIAEMAMQKINRSVGEAWSSTDIWFRKAQLWWGTLLSGGDAGKAVQKYESYVDDIKQANAEAFKVQADMAKREPVSKFFEDFDYKNYDNMIDAVNAAGNLFKGTIDREGVIRYADVTNDIIDLTNKLGDKKVESILTESAMIDFKDLTAEFEKGNLTVDEYRLKVKKLENNLKDATDEELNFFKEVRKDNREGENPLERFWSTTEFMLTDPVGFVKEGTSKLVALGTDIYEGVVNELSNTEFVGVYGGGLSFEELLNPEALDEAVEKIENIGDMTFPEFKEAFPNLYNEIFYQTGEVGEHFDKQKESIKDLTAEYEPLQIQQEAWRESSEHMMEWIDGLEENIQTYKDNINTLNLSIKNLNEEVTNTYAAFSGDSFSGVKEWEIAITAAGAQLDRFNRYAQMTIKYGDSMKTNFMDGTESIMGEIDAFNDLDNWINWYNKDVWNAVKSNNDFDGSLKDVITGLQSYQSEIEDANTRLEEYRLELLKIDLKEMEQRHGLSRRDERRRKEIQIEMTKEQIAIKEEQVGKEEEGVNTLNRIFQEYVDRTNLKYSELEDTYDQDINNQWDMIVSKRKNLKDYEGWLEENKNALVNTELKYVGTMKVIAEDDELAEAYKEITGINAIEQAKGEWNAFREGFGENFDSPLPTYDVVSGGLGVSRDLTGDLWRDLPKIEDYLGDLIGYRGRQRGDYYIPKTQPYLLHKGEQVVSAGKTNTGRKNVHIHLDPLEINAVINDNTDLQSFGTKIGRAIGAGFVSGIESEYQLG